MTCGSRRVGEMRTIHDSQRLSRTVLQGRYFKGKGDTGARKPRLQPSCALNSMKRALTLWKNDQYFNIWRANRQKLQRMFEVEVSRYLSDLFWVAWGAHALRTCNSLRGHHLLSYVERATVWQPMKHEDEKSQKCSLDYCCKGTGNDWSKPILSPRK